MLAKYISIFRLHFLFHIQKKQESYPMYTLVVAPTVKYDKKKINKQIFSLHMRLK